MKKNTIVLFSLLTTLSVSAQEVVATQGDSYTNASGNIDFTIGEVIIDTGTDGTNDLTQGFHQTNWNFLGVDNHEQNSEATVYPNPMGTELYIQTENFEFMSYVLYDATGRIVAENKLNALQTGIDVSTFAPSSYSLVLQDENQNKIKTFKLIKTQ